MIFCSWTAENALVQDYVILGGASAFFAASAGLGEQRKAATVTDHFLCNLVQTGLIELGVENPGTQRQLLAWETLQSVNVNRFVISV